MCTPEVDIMAQWIKQPLETLAFHMGASLGPGCSALTQVPANASRKTSEIYSNAMAPVTHVGDTDEVPSFQLHPCPALFGPFRE